MNMNIGSDSNNINYNSNKKENINSSSISTGKQFVKDSIEQYNNTSSYGSTPEIETMDLSFATEQLEENKNTLTSRLKSFFNSLLAKEDETSSSVTFGVQSKVESTMLANTDNNERLDESISTESVNEELIPFRDTSTMNEEELYDYWDSHIAKYVADREVEENIDTNVSSIFVGDTSYSNDNSSEVDYSAFVENCQAMIDSMDAEIAAKEKEFYEKYGDNTSSAVDFRVTYEDEFNSTQQAIQNMLDQLEDMLPIEYINEYCVEAYGGEGITYDALVSLYNAALNGDQEAHNRFTEIMRGGFSKLQNADSSYTDESVNYLMESEVNGLFENIVDKITYINNLVAPAVQMAQEIRALKDARNNMFMYSHAYILELPEVKEYTTEELLQYFTEEELALLGEGKDEARIYAYLMKNALLDDADEYMNGLRGILNQLQGMQWAREWAEEIVEDDGDLLSDLWHNNLSGTWGGIVNFGYGFYNMFSNILDPDKPMSAEAWKQTFIMTMLSDVETVENEDGTITEKASIIEELYGKDSLEYELYMKIQDLDYRWLLSFDYQLSLSGGNMLPTMLVSTGLSFIPGVGPTLARKVGAGMMFVSTMGNAVDSAYQRDISGFEAYLYGALMAYSEMSLEKVLGGIPYLSDASGFTLRSFLGEGFEEGLQTYVEFFADAAFFNEPIDLESFLGTSGDSAAAFGMGVVMSIFTNGGQVPINIGANAVKVITTDDVLKFYKTDMNGESYFDAFAFGEYLLGMNSLNNNNQRTAMEHFIDSGTVSVVNNDVLYETLMDLDSSALFEILTTCDDETRAVLLANMNEVDLKDIIVSSTKGVTEYLDAQSLLDEHRAIQESLKQTAQEQTAQTNSNVETDGKNKSNVLSSLFFKLLNLPLPDEVKLKLIEKMSDEDKVKALECLKNERSVENIISSIEDKILKYRCSSNPYISSEYYCELYDQFISDISAMSNTEIIDFVNKIGDDYCKSWCLNFLNDQSDLYNVILSIESESIVANCLKYLTDEDIVVDIVLSFTDERNRALCLEFVTNLTNQCKIAKTLNNEELNKTLILKVEEELKSRTENIWASKCSEVFFKQAVKEFGIEYCLNYFNPRAWSEDIIIFIKDNSDIIDYISDYHLKEFLKFILNSSDLDLIGEVLQYINYNPYLLDNFVNKYFNEKNIQLFGVDRLVEIISFPEILDMFSSLCSNENSFYFFCKIVDKLNSYSNDVLYQPYIKKLLELFNKKSTFFNSFFSLNSSLFESDEKMNICINLFLSLAISDNEILYECIDSFDFSDNIDDFLKKYFSNIEKKYNNTDDIDVKKDLFLLMCYGISLEEAKRILNMFSLNNDSIFMDSEIENIYNAISNIVNDVVTLPDVYNYNDDENIYNFSPVSILLRQHLINLYSEYYMEHTFKIEEHMRTENKTVSVVDNDGNVVKYDIPCYELDESSILFVHRKDAFKVSDNSQSFLDSVNYYDIYYSCDREHAYNHTLCTSVISGDRGSYAQNGGVIYGYSEWDVSSMALMGTGDLSSYISGYTIDTNRPFLNVFMNIDDLLNQTSLYNEVTFDRNGIDPSCIFIDGTMSQKQLQESYQAAYDWGLPIVYRK